jgi:hypothetical protein
MTPRSAVLTRYEAAAFVDHTPPQAIHLTHDGVLSTDRKPVASQPSERAELAERVKVPLHEDIQICSPSLQ